jgi:hypothetical protein
MSGGSERGPVEPDFQPRTDLTGHVEDHRLFPKRPIDLVLTDVVMLTAFQPECRGSISSDKQGTWACCSGPFGRTEIMSFAHRDILGCESPNQASSLRLTFPKEITA